jgi:hypothetical protein
MSEPWEKAATVGPEAMPEDLLEACQDETRDPWSDLSSARSAAIDRNTRWSMHCDWLTTRIVILSGLAGVTDWDQIPADLILDGTYAGIMAAAGLDSGPAPDVTQLRALLDLTAGWPRE